MIDPEFAVYLRTYQPSENEAQKEWRRRVARLWEALRAEGPHANHGLIKCVEWLGNRGPRRDLQN